VRLHWALLSVALGARLLAAPAHGGAITAAGHALHFEGIAPPATTALRFAMGPRAASEAFGGREESTLTAHLLAPLQERGTVAMWLCPDRTYRSGRTTRYAEHRLLEIDQLVALSLVVEPESVTLYVGWGPRREVVTPGARGVRRSLAYDQSLRVILPEFPAAWHHLAVTWDAARGEANVFLDGTPYERPGSTIDRWTANRGENLTLHLSPDLLYADVRVRSTPLAGDELKAMVGPERWGALDDWLGVRDLGPLTADGLRGRVIYARNLESADDTRDWVLEGPGETTFAANGMTMRSKRPDGPNGHVVYWAPDEFPADFMAEFDFEVLTEHGLNILFFAARGVDGEDALATTLTRRDGTFIQYTHGDLNSYHISYFANSPNDARSVANLRKNSGFFLLANGPVGVAAGGRGEVHHALLVKSGGHIRMAVDGRVIIAFKDDGIRAGPVWQGGKIGFRQMQWSATRYHRLRISAVRAEPPQL
jgi:hypothetical protein